MSCGCNFDSSQAVLDRIRAKGVADEKMQQSYELVCQCGATVNMETYITNCPVCNMTYGVTPCSSDNPENIVMVQEN